MEVFPKGFKTTKDIKVPAKTIGQVIGQEKAVEIIKKAAAQKRNVLLVGIPGTGKSMLAQAMAEILPIENLEDILIYPNNMDPNNPKVKTAKAGEGKKILNQARIDAMKEGSSAKIVAMILPLLWFIFSFVIWRLGWIPDVVYAAALILGGFVLIAAALSTQMKSRETAGAPKLLVDNSGKRIAPFIEATGAKSGALLGDVRHDPLQCFYGFSELYLEKEGQIKPFTFAELWDKMFQKYGKNIITNEKGYEAIMLPPEEKIYTLGCKEGKVVFSRILSLNRQPFDSEIVDIRAGDKTLSVTPEHKFFTTDGDKEAGKISEKHCIFKLSQQ